MHNEQTWISEKQTLYLCPYLTKDQEHLLTMQNTGTSALSFSSLSHSHFLIPSPFLYPGEDSDSDSDLSMEEERSLSIPSSESEDNVRLRGRIQRRFKRSNHGERLLTEPANNGTKGRLFCITEFILMLFFDIFIV